MSIIRNIPVIPVLPHGQELGQSNQLQMLILGFRGTWGAVQKCGRDATPPETDSNSK